MALAPLRVRRAVALPSSLLRGIRLFSAPASSPGLAPPAPATAGGSSLPVGSPGLRRPHSLVQSLPFRSSAPLRSSRYGGGSEDKISPDEILFEGCDYNHWLITMDFPKDPAPTREEMIETYIQTLAKVVGSVEEAKKRMYALSTTTYHGFQAVMTEEMSEKFRGLPGVVFILPDSYIDPVNKEYGGDKYENGVITPRPPPIQYGRQARGRNMNRSDRGNYNSPPPQGSQPNYQQQSSRQGDEWRSRSQHNYNQPGQYGRSYDAPGQRRDFRQGDERNSEQSSVREGYQGEHREPMPSYQGNFNQGGQGNFAPPGQRNFARGPGGENMFGNPSSYDNNRPGSGPGNTQDYRQGSGPGYAQDYSQGAGPGHAQDYRQGSGPGYAQDYSQGAGPGHTQDYRQGSGPGYTRDYRQDTGVGYSDGQINSNYSSANSKGGGAGYWGSYQQELGSTNGRDNYSGPTEGHQGS